jgi:CRISPR-associated protein Csb2
VLPALFYGYRRRREASSGDLARSRFEDDWLILALEGPERSGLPILATAAVAAAVRGALQKHATDPVPEVISGHGRAGEPSERPHLAIVPLPSVGHHHADGRILGVALILPRESDPAERRAVYRAIDAWEGASRSNEDLDDAPPLRLLLGAGGDWRLRRVDEVSRLATLRSETWCAYGSRVWMSATPVALDRNPGDLTTRDPAKAAAAFAEAQAVVAAACERIALPSPDGVWVTRSALLAGSEKAQRFPRYPTRQEKTQRVLVHATLRFPQPVVGPVLLGAGRYRGLGLFRPVPVELLTTEEREEAEVQEDGGQQASTILGGA